MPNIKQMFSDISRPKKRPKSGLLKATSVANDFRYFKAKKRPKSGLLKAKSVANDFRHFKAKKRPKSCLLKAKYVANRFRHFKAIQNRAELNENFDIKFQHANHQHR